MTEPTDPFAEAKRREHRLVEQLRACPVVELMGVVGADGVAGVKSGGADLWTLLFKLHPWRIVGQDLQSQPLTVRREMSREELHRARAQVTPYAVLRVTARVDANSVFNTPQALLEPVIGIDTSDSVLNAHADQLQKAVLYNDPTFGTFTLDRRVNWYTAQVMWDDKAISLSLSADDSSELQEALNAARVLWESQAAWAQRISDYAVEQVLPLKNGTWREPGEPELTAQEFKERMRLESITVEPDGSFDFWHNDGDLFWGHSIQISGSVTGGPTSADIPG